MPRSGEGARRLLGVDVARCLALVGMVATHVVDPRDPDGSLSAAQWLAGGRASALFAVLLGVSLALTTGRREPVQGRERAARSAGVVVRAVLIGLLGLALGQPDSGLAVILTYYAVLLLLALPFLGLRPPALLGLAAAWVVAAPLFSYVLRAELAPRGVASPTFAQLVADPTGLLAELLWTGYYPAVPWLSYVLVGLALGRLDLARRAVATAIALGGLVLAVGASALAGALVARTDLTAAQLDEAAGGMFGTTPPGEPGWLVAAAPHSSTTLDLLQTTGSAGLVLGLCLLLDATLVRHGLDVARRAVGIVFGAGTMVLTLYSLHVLLRTDRLWPPEESSAYPAHLLVLLGIGALYAAAGRRGPLEQLVSLASQGAARLVRGRPGRPSDRPSAGPAAGPSDG